ncbi:VPS10 domain-containing protein, partial [Alishewanella longhuensis]
DNTYTTGAITSACGVQASFSQNSYSVTASAGMGGSISPGSVTVNHGSSASFTISADHGYSIESVTGCDGSLEGTIYTTGEIKFDCEVRASFTRELVTVTAEWHGNGTVEPAQQQVPVGSTATFKVIPIPGNNVTFYDTCRDNGDIVGQINGNSYTTGILTQNCLIVFQFSAANYEVRASTSIGGTTIPFFATAGYLDQVEFEIKADESHEVESIEGCKGELKGTIFKTEPLTASCDIFVKFRALQYGFADKLVLNEPRGPSILRHISITDENTWYAGAVSINGAPFSLARSDNKGKSWQYLPAHGAKVIPVPNYPGRLIATMGPVPQQLMQISKDFGASWQDLYANYPDGVRGDKYFTDYRGERVVFSRFPSQRHTLVTKHGVIFSSVNMGRDYLLRSDDGGENFYEISSPLAGQGIFIFDFAVVPEADDYVIYAAARLNQSPKLFVTSDNGESWQVTGVENYQPMPHELPYVILTQRAYSAITGFGVFDHLNSSFTDYSADLPRTEMFRISVNPYNTDEVFFYSGQTFISNEGSPGLYQSFNRGATWQMVAGTTEKYIGSVAVEPSGKLLYIALNGRSGLYRQGSVAGEWQLQSAELSLIDASPYREEQFFNPRWPDIMFVANQDTMQRSLDSGLNWESASQGFDFGNYGPEAVLISSYQSGLFLAGSTAGLFISRDAGTTWQQKSDQRIYQIIESPADPKVIYARTFEDKMLKTTDGGSSWEFYNTVYFPLFPPSSPLAFQLDVKNPDKLYFSSGSQLYMSLDGGKTAEPIGPLFPQGVELRGYDMSNDKVLFVFAGRNIEAIGGMMMSEDGGFTWRKISGNLATNFWPSMYRSLVVQVHPDNPQILFGRSRNEGTFYVSENRGESWYRPFRWDTSAPPILGVHFDVKSDNWYFITNSGLHSAEKYENTSELSIKLEKADTDVVSSVLADNYGLSCGENCKYRFKNGSAVTLRILSEAPAVLPSICEEKTGGMCSFTLDRDIEVIFDFK